MAPNLLHIYFTNKRHYYIPEYNNDTPIPYYADIAKYLAMTLDAKLQWIAQIKKKKDELNLKLGKMFMGRNFSLSV